MTVELEDRRAKDDPDKLPGIGLANGTWWTIVFLRGMEKLPQVEQRCTNDPWVVSPRTAQKMADIVDAWTPPKLWASPDNKVSAALKENIVYFLRNCNGFRSY
ncbi:particle associated protein [Yersinia phage fHe-Yen8-01]|nr:particle associated protein [Yersinia phage fHe-Yen8-01]